MSKDKSLDFGEFGIATVVISGADLRSGKAFKKPKPAKKHNYSKSVKPLYRPKQSILSQCLQDPE